MLNMEAFYSEKNIINVYGPVTDELANNVIFLLQYLDYRFEEMSIPIPERKIIMQINSPGGSVNAGLAIYDMMCQTKAIIQTVAIGCAQSMGAFLLAAGTKGHRSALPNSEILIHQPLGGTRGQASDMIIAVEHMKKIKHKLNQYMADFTGKAISVIEKDTDRDFIMSADEAKKYGIVDFVYSARKTND